MEPSGYNVLIVLFIIDKNDWMMLSKTATKTRRIMISTNPGSSGFNGRFEKAPYKYHPNIKKVVPKEAIKLFSLNDIFIINLHV